MAETKPQAAPSTDAHEKMGFWRQYLFSVDHKVIGKQYLFLGLFMGFIGVGLSFIFRWQLAWPGTAVPIWGKVTAPQYYEFVTMHGTIMVFFVAMPVLLGAFGNFLIPLMVGARDMAFPRLNMASFWTIFVGSVLLLASFFVPGGASHAGWTNYVPLSDASKYLPGNYWGGNLWLIALAIDFASVLMGGINFLTTAIAMRAPGMTIWRMPLLVWQELVASVLFMLSVGPLIAGVVMLLFDRMVGTGFFLPEKGADPLLWQHLFWFFGHPEVYVVAMPGLGIVQEILPVFARKPIFGYRMIVWSVIVAGILSFTVWAHHMFVSGMNPVLAEPFSVTTIAISIPFAVMLFAMIATLWRGQITFSTPMLFALGALANFLLGGVTGIPLGTNASDIYLHDTYFVIAHFHNTLVPTAIIAGFGGIYYWFPKMFGRMMNETLGKVHFVFTWVGFNMVFVPLFLIGLGGGQRRIYMSSVYTFYKPLQPLHVIATIGLIVIIVGQIPFLVNFFLSMFRGAKAPANPWHANTLEWATDSPPPHENFHTIPTVVRGPYEYSVPGMEQDWAPQAAAVNAGAAQG
ncbi:cytochrome c oxidase subunit I [Candidatus Binatus sp.]|jgi:cytochrome c oxidase subunit 1|uniref:cytochrome c oxidase subunit I n=1 Tax=Candidatus Binatus sp. TaxID=2811406 RepID=UPI003BCDAD52